MLACNWLAVETFARCQAQYAIGMAGAACMGLAAAEVHAVLAMRRTPRRHWPQLLDDVQTMGRAAARAINQRIARER